MGYVIVTDSIPDLEEAFLLQNGICTVPLRFTVDGWDTVEDDFGRTVSFASFYQNLREGKHITTEPAQKTTFTSVFEGILKSSRDVVYLGLSSGLSENYQTACEAAEELKGRYINQVYCVDTLAVSGGQALLVREAARCKAQGMMPEQLVEWLEAYRSHVVHLFLVDDIQYLQRHGDVEHKSSLFGSRGSTSQLLQLDAAGRLVLGKKVRGHRKALELLEKQAAAQLPKGSEAYISHADCREDAEELAKYLLDHAGAQHVEFIILNEVVGAHAGPGAIGVFFHQNQ